MSSCHPVLPDALASPSAPARMPFVMNPGQVLENLIGLRENSSKAGE